MRGTLFLAPAFKSEVILGGRVRTMVERQDAIRAAWSAPGVTKVTNTITIHPYAYA